MCFPFCTFLSLSLWSMLITISGYPDGCLSPESEGNCLDRNAFQPRLWYSSNTCITLSWLETIHWYCLCGIKLLLRLTETYQTLLKSKWRGLENDIWIASSEFGTYRLCEQRRFRRACASAQSRQNLRCSLKQAVSQEEPSHRKPDPCSLWMAGHAQLKFVMTECSKTQIRLTGLILRVRTLFYMSESTRRWLKHQVINWRRSNWKHKDD